MLKDKKSLREEFKSNGIDVGLTVLTLPHYPPEYYQVVFHYGQIQQSPTPSNDETRSSSSDSQ